ncbi:MAG: YabP/YqfC family sporulation protein [Lachnospiraceae bacterium]|nr:YabP/YqfC family sporulation protein [Lachnospiraceae bacterium]
MFRRKEEVVVAKKHARHRKEKVAPEAREPVISRILTERLRLSEDVLGKAPILMGYGNRRFCIENYSNIIEYTKERIRIQTKTGRIHILGKNLVIAYYRDDGMCVVGEVTSVEYHK